MRKYGNILYHCGVFTSLYLRLKNGNFFQQLLSIYHQVSFVFLSNKYLYKFQLRVYLCSERFGVVYQQKKKCCRGLFYKVTNLHVYSTTSTDLSHFMSVLELCFIYFCIYSVSSKNLISRFYSNNAYNICFLFHFVGVLRKADSTKGS